MDRQEAEINLRIAKNKGEKTFLGIPCKKPQHVVNGASMRRTFRGTPCAACRWEWDEKQKVLKKNPNLDSPQKQPPTPPPYLVQPTPIEEPVEEPKEKNKNIAPPPYDPGSPPKEPDWQKKLEQLCQLQPKPDEWDEAYYIEKNHLARLLGPYRTSSQCILAVQELQKLYVRLNGEEDKLPK